MNKKLAAVVEKYRSHPEFLGIDIADPNQPGAVDDTLLHLAARTGAVEDVEVLIASGAKVDSVGDLGNTPLQQAAMSGRLQAVKILLKFGASVSHKNEFGQTAIDIAELGGHSEIVSVLKSHAK